MTGFRADGYGAGQRVRQASFDQSGRGTQKTDAEVMLNILPFPDFSKCCYKCFAVKLMG